MNGTSKVTVSLVQIVMKVSKGGQVYLMGRQKVNNWFSRAAMGKL